MNTQTRNEAAERDLFGPYLMFVADKWEDDERSGLFTMGVYISLSLPRVLAAERRATVERIRAAVAAGRIGISGQVTTPNIDAILDEEAAR